MLLFPAIDLRRGRCLRTDQGTSGGSLQDTDPFRVAERFARSGAEWIHIVDLDAAFGEGSNRTLVAEMARALPVRIQLGGGVRSEADLEEVLEGPVERVVVGTAAVERPDLAAWAVERWGAARIAVGLDARGRTPVAHQTGDARAADIVHLACAFTARGIGTLIYTDVDGDGKLAGLNVALAAELADSSGADIVISGGLSDTADLDALSVAVRDRPGIVGAIVGQAMYESRLSMAAMTRMPMA